MSVSKRSLFDFRLGEKKICLGRETKIMGVLNVTPDSFSDGGRYVDPATAQARALRMESEGAHFIDVGGESTRPGSRPVSWKEEVRRVCPVLKRIVGKVGIPVSIDTYKYEVALAALDEGALLVNDIRALRGNKRLAKAIARYKAGVVLMHMPGEPATMQNKARYRNVVSDVRGYLRTAIDRALDAGIDRSRILVDPGFGFGKTTEHNLKLLNGLAAFGKLKCPMLVGLSRKSFIGNVLGVAVKDRLYGSLAAAAAAIHEGAHVLRVHDVLAHRQLALFLDKTCVQRAND